MKKLKKIIAINIIGLISVLFLIELISFLIIFCRYYRLIVDGDQWTNWISFKNLNNIEDKYNFLPPYKYKGTDNKSIVILGCSYAIGACLDYEDTPSSQLAKYLKTTVYNKSIPGMGTASALYVMSKDNIKEEIPDAKYFVYIFLDDHIRRNKCYIPNHIYNEFSAKYNLDKNNNLHFVKLNKLQYLLYSSYTFRLYDEYLRMKEDKEKDYLLLDAIITKLSEEIKTKYPNSKFIILFYDDNLNGRDINNIEHNKNLDQICKKNNIQLIYTSDLKCGKDILERKYLTWDKIHPSKEVWQQIIPEFVKLTGMQK